MTRRVHAVLCALVLLAMVLRPRAARAEGTSATAVPVMVLAFDSEDAEDQADGLTAAVRSRVRASHAWTLVEGNQSLGMLTAALKCPARPTPECQQKIADQIRQSSYVWGLVKKAGSGQVEAEAHLFQRGKADTVATERYADNLKDGNDDALRRIAQRLLDKLSGVALATLVVKAGSLNGEVVIDGDKRFPLKNGSARIELSPDTHAVEIAAPGATAGNKKNVLLAAGKETTVDLSPAAQPAMPGTVAPPAEEAKSFPTRKVVGGAMAVVGVGLGVLAVERYSSWSSTKDKVENADVLSTINTNGQPVSACSEVVKNAASSLCRQSDEANTAGITGIVAGSVGAILLVGGAYLFFTDGGSKEKTASARPRVRQLSPWMGAGSAGMALGGQF